MTTFTRVFITGAAAVAILGAPLAARQDPPPVASSQAEQKAEQKTAEPTTVEVDAAAEVELKRQVSLFEGVLRQAVERGGQRLAQWASDIAPGVTLAQASNPVIQAVPLPDGSLIFNVQVPEILQTSLLLVQRMQRPQQGAQPVATPAPGRVGSTGVVQADPMAGPDANRNPDSVYSDYVRETLIDALLDGSAVLQLRPGQWLTVAASGVDSVFSAANPLYRSPSRKLVLSVKAEDLLAFRRQEISREQVRSRILERRF